jgi:uncharacterized membrane protein HdeD (DUF308 family)
MTGARGGFVAVVLAVGVAVLAQGLVRLVEASGAKDQPAVVLILLLAAFLGLLTAIVTRSMRLPGAMAPTVLVLGWIVVPPILGVIPSDATQYFGRTAALSIADAVALAVAVIAAAVTLGVQSER